MLKVGTRVLMKQSVAGLDHDFSEGSVVIATEKNLNILGSLIRMGIGEELFPVDADNVQKQLDENRLLGIDQNNVIRTPGAYSNFETEKKDMELLAPKKKERKKRLRPE